ncbi:MAG: glycosyltransferase family 2 protein [Lachnospiraceae bacterium]|nr:glycosyltransferase family 2 protein [Lachnospiraceae bacterium]
MSRTVDLVVPCYNEQDVIASFYKETNAVVKNIPGFDFRYIFIDDGSRDNTLPQLKALAALHPEVGYISFSRNFGKEAGIYAGLKASTADLVAVMDADLQHPPSMLPDMIAGIDEGHDCVAARRITRKGEGRVKSWLSSLFYKFSNAVSDVKMEEGAVDYRMMTRQMINAVLSLCERQRFSKGIFMWVGFDTKWIPYENVERTAGTSKWSIRSLFKYAMDGIMCFSTAPLKMVSWFGGIVCLLSFVYIIATLIQTSIFGIDVPGYVTTLCAVLFLGGAIEFSIGILGEYISRIYLEVKNRPIYIAKETNIHNGNDEEAVE